MKQIDFFLRVESGASRPPGVASDLVFENTGDRVAQWPDETAGREVSSIAALCESGIRERKPERERARTCPVMHVVLEERYIIDLHKLTAEFGNGPYLGEEVVQSMAFTDRVHNSVNPDTSRPDDPLGKVAYVDHLNEAASGCRGEYAAALTQPCRPIPESVARVTRSHDETGPYNEELFGQTGSGGALSSYLRLGVVGEVLWLDKLGRLVGSGLVVSRIYRHGRQQGLMTRPIREGVERRLDQFRLVGELDDLVPLAVQLVVCAG